MAKGLWVVLNVSSIEKSVEFYKSLGLKAGKESQGPMTWGFVNASPDSGIVLWDKAVMGPDQPADTKEWLSGELGKGVLFTIGVANAEKAWAKAQAVRATIDQSLRAQEWGGKEFTVVDPDGFVINISDRFPGAPAKPAKKAKRAAKRVAAKAKGAVKRVARKAKPAKRRR